MAILDSLMTQYKSLILQLQMTGKAQLEKELIDFFTKCKIITAIKWRQYTPYFNDGDECIFRVQELEYKILKTSIPANCGCGANLTPKDKFCSQCGQATAYSVNESDWLESYSLNRQKIPGLDVELVGATALKLSSSDDILNILFGDHVEVTATVAGILTKPYEHE